MLAAYSPFHGDDEEKLFKAIKEGEVKYPASFSEEAKSFIKCLLEKEPIKRLGMPTSSHGNIRENKFFSKIDWIRLQNRQVEPPYMPKLKASTDHSNFDVGFPSSGKPKLSQIDKKLLKTIDEAIFKGFSFMSKDFDKSV